MSERSAAVDDDVRAAFVYQEALRGLLQQQAAVESLHARAATLIFAASFASSLLGARALTEPPPMAGVHRELTLQINSDWKRNGRIVRRLREALQLALILLLLEIVAWLVSIADAGGA